MLRRKTPNMAQPRPAHALWQQLPMVEAIVDAAQETDRAALKATCVTLAQAVDRPSLWAQRYAPCRVDHADHRITTFLELRFDEAKHRHLGQHAGHVWTLQGGYEPALPKEAQLLALLDEAEALGRQQLHAGNTALDHNDVQRRLLWHELLTAGYRLRMNTSPARAIMALQIRSMLRSPGCMLGALTLWTLAALTLRYHDARSCGAPEACLSTAPLASASPECASLAVVLTCLMVHAGHIRDERVASLRLREIACSLYDAASVENS